MTLSIEASSIGCYEAPQVRILAHFTTRMRDLRVHHQLQPIAGIAGPKSEIGLFRIQEEPFVPATDSVDGSPRDEHCRTGCPVSDCPVAVERGISDHVAQHCESRRSMPAEHGFARCTQDCRFTPERELQLTLSPTHDGHGDSHLRAVLDRSCEP